MSEPGALTVRDAGARDLAACARWAREAGVPSWTRATLATCLKNAQYRLFAAERAGRSIGFALARGAADELELFVLAVDAAERRGGVGRALWGAVLGFAERGRAVRIGLEVRASNQGARNFYGRMGLRPVGHRRQYYADGQDAVLMCLELPPQSLRPRPDLVVLAGGQGRRLGGVVKARLVRDERTLLERTIEVLRSETERVFVVAPASVELGPAPGPYTRIEDRGEGPARALIQAVALVSAPWVFVAAVDHVFWTADLVAHLSVERQPGVDAVVVREGGFVQPFGALYRADALRAAGEREDARSLSALRDRMVVRELDGSRLSGTLRRAFLDVDVPEDLRYLR